MKFLILAVCVAVASANTAYPSPAYPAPAYPSPAYKPESYPPQPYSFAWEVNDAPSYNNYAHSESSDGKVTTGSYRVALPDGRTQIVTYKADAYGYTADVKYEGEAKYPEYKPAASYPAPAYKAPSYPAPGYPAPAYKPESYAPQPYSFAWEVNDAPSYNNYAHSESSDGKVTTGSYRVLLPDGRTQVVTYKADSYGYTADVKYEGEAKYPEYKPAASYPAPAYKAPAYPAPAYPAPAYPAPVYKAPAKY
ncbi:adhesive plaque matrix protein-like isoform X2 [Daphnia carinata]|uniref:adhesive plaque matrix protein-like isoform X2 n=1 Tax=Daphnia carinata TaxID=120202 RepID=UPI002869779E|nr:adhesive plaque matrix protein-like isoform X2 [Daphnia carinata]